VERLKRIHVEADYITGDVPAEDRQPKVDKFQAGGTRVLVNTIMAGGVGLTLTAADTAIFAEEDWTPANNEQAEDRLHRIGQQNPVTIIQVRTADSVDTKRVAPRNELKRMIAGAVLGNDVPQEVAE
jgi:SNF2 family DNA or RNA helicase